MDIQRFYQDLKTFPKHDIMLMAKMYNFNGTYNDLLWMIAIKNASKAQMITGDPNLDLEILQAMDDEELLRICDTNKEIRKLCEPIFRERLLARGFEVLGEHNTWREKFKNAKKAPHSHGWQMFVIDKKGGKSMSKLQQAWRKLSPIEKQKYVDRYLILDDQEDSDDSE